MPGVVTYGSDDPDQIGPVLGIRPDDERYLATSDEGDVIRGLGGLSLIHI